MSDELVNPEVDALARHILQGREPVEMVIKGDTATGSPDVPAILTPDADGSWWLRDATEHSRKYAMRPDRRKGTARATTLASMVALIDHHDNGDTMVFVDEVEFTMTAVINYSEEVENGDYKKAAFGDHRIVYEFPISEEFAAWRDVSTKDMGAFQRFLNDRALDLAEPPKDLKATKESEVPAELRNLWRIARRLNAPGYATPADMHSLARGLELRATGKVTNIVREQSGEAVIHFEDTHEARNTEGKSVEVPHLFLISVPVFHRGDNFLLPCRLTYSKDGPGIRWTITVYRIEDAIRLAIEEAANTVASETGRPWVFGRPERS